MKWETKEMLWKKKKENKESPADLPQFTCNDNNRNTERTQNTCAALNFALNTTHGRTKKKKKKRTFTVIPSICCLRLSSIMCTICVRFFYFFCFLFPFVLLFFTARPSDFFRLHIFSAFFFFFLAGSDGHNIVTTTTTTKKKHKQT